MSTRRASSPAGFTILEMMIVVVMLALVACVLGVVSLTGGPSGQASVLSDLDATGARVAERVAEELAAISGSQMLPDPAGTFGTDTLDFVQALGVAAGAPIWGPRTRLTAEYEAGEADDGADNDGDGLVDERALILIRDVDSGREQREVLVGGLAEWAAGEVPGNGIDDNRNGIVDEQGFNLHRVGGVITIRIWLQASGSDGRTLVREVSRTVRPRSGGG